MVKRLGVWIDSRKAVVVPIEDGSGEAGPVRRISTDLEKQLRLSSGARGKTSYGPQTAPSDDMRETSSAANLRVFFDEVIEALRGGRFLFVFGPGEAKEKFRKRLDVEALGAQIEGMETAGRMTERQIAARVRAHFESASSPVGRRP